MGRAARLNTSPLRDAALLEAQRDVEAVLADAERRASADIERARVAAEALVARARADGDTAGALETARDRSAARARARRILLEARREAYDDLRRRCREGALALRAQDDYPALLDRLADAARAQLGPGSEVELDPPEVGGVRAHVGKRRVDYTLPVLADRCLEALGPDLLRLW